MGANTGQTALMVTGAVVGGTIGALAGGPKGALMGAQLGLTAGSMIGQAAFPEPPMMTEGPRLGDLAATSSAYGVPLTISYGTMRLPGNLIWALPKIERKTVTTQSGGKGGQPKQKHTTYSYFGTFAYAFGEGSDTADVLRIWADNRLIFDKTDLSNITHAKGLNFRWYPGTEDQLPDPAIEARHGAGRTPAFRGICYLVIEDFPLAEYGNRFPAITAEITFIRDLPRISQVSEPLSGPLTTFNSQTCGVDWQRGLAYVLTTNSDPNLAGIRKFSLTTMKEIQQRQAVDAIPQVSPAVNSSLVSDWCTVAPTGDLLTNIGSGNARAVGLFDRNTLVEKNRFGVVGSAVNNSPSSFEAIQVACCVSHYTENGRNDYMVSVSVFNSVGVLHLGDMSYVWDSDTGMAPTGIPDGDTTTVCVGKIGDRVCTAYVRGEGLSVTFPRIRIYEVTIMSGISISTFGSVSETHNASIREVLNLVPDDLFPGAGATSFADKGGLLIYDQTDDSLIVGAEISSPVTIRKMFKFKPDGTKIWETDALTAAEYARNDTRHLGVASVVRGGTLGWMSGTNGMLMNTVDGTFIHRRDTPNYPTPPTTSTFGRGQYNSYAETVVGPSNSSTTPIGRWFFRRNTGLGAPLISILENMVERVGLDPINDTESHTLIGVNVPGYAIARQTSGRGVIQALTHIYDFDAVESEGLLKFVQRGGSSVQLIPHEDFGELNNEGLLVESTRAQEVELPLRVTLTYLDREHDFQQNSHSAKRIAVPTPSSFSSNEMNFEFAGAVTSEFAKQAAEKLLIAAWIERNRHKIRLPWKYLALDPSDVVTVIFQDNRARRGRITQLDIGVDYQLELMFVEEEEDQFTSKVSADAGSGWQPSSVQGAGFVELTLLDIPLLRDIDDIGRLANVLYGLMGAMEADQFRAGTVYISQDGVNFLESKSFVSEKNWGTILGTLPDPVLVDQIDEETTITVFPGVGLDELDSVSELEMLNGANAAAVVKPNGEVEVIQYQTVDVNMDGSVTLSRLLRGRRGTELMAFDHASHEMIVFLIPVDVELIVRPLSDFNVPTLYRAVGDGQLLEDGINYMLTSQHRSLKPYAVVHHKAEFGTSDSIDLSWVRRTRVGGELIDGIGTVPVSEDEEEYELEIFDGPGGTLVRTVQGLTSPQYNYSSAEQTTDGFTAPVSSITIQVYQMSAQVGRGFSREVTLNVE